MRFKLLTILLFSFSAYAQETIWQDYIENLNVSEERNLVDLLDAFHHYQKHPLDLNTQEEDDFYAFPFFSDYQIAQLLIYRKKLNGFVEKGELRCLGVFTTDELQFILPLITVRFSYDKTVYSSYSLEQIVRYARVTERQVGFGKQLKGSKPTLFFRNKQQWDDLLKVGLTLQKDAGEYLYHQAYPNGVDFVSASIAYSPKTRNLKKVIIGDYALNFGQGLVLWNGFAMGKGVAKTVSNKNSPSLLTYHSSDEVHFMRGLAIESNKNHFTFTPFVSFKKVDALIKEDTSITSIRVDGFHRTASEIANKGTVKEWVYGGNLTYKKGNKKAGLRIVAIDYSQPLVYQSTYQKQFTTGKKQVFTSFDHTVIGNNWEFFGEIAVDKKINYALLQGLNFYPSPNLSFNTTWRKYSSGYRSFYANSFGERQSANNEMGIYNGVTLHLGNGFSVKSYVDLYSFPSFSYGKNHRLVGQDYFTELKKKLSDNSLIYFRLKSEKRVTQSLENEKEHISRLRIHYKTQWNKFTFQSRVEGAKFNTSEHGFLVFQDIKTQLRHFTINTRLAYFNAPTYQSAIYAYQPNFLYAFRSMAYFNRGFQILLMTKIHLSEKIKLWFKYQRTTYLNQATVGSGYYETTVPHLSEISFQIYLLL